MVDQTTDGFNHVLQEAEEVVALLAKLRAKVDPMSTEHKYNDLIIVMNDKRADLATAGNDDDHYSDALQAYQVAYNNVKVFKRENMAAILEERKQA